MDVLLIHEMILLFLDLGFVIGFGSFHPDSGFLEVHRHDVRSPFGKCAMIILESYRAAHITPPRLVQPSGYPSHILAADFVRSHPRFT